MHAIILRHMSSEMTPSCLSEIVAILVHGVDSDILIRVYAQLSTILLSIMCCAHVDSYMNDIDVSSTEVHDTSRVCKE